MIKFDDIASSSTVAELYRKLPKEWQEWPTRVELAFSLTGGGGVTSEDYRRFHADTLFEAALFLFDPQFSRRSFRYFLKTDGILPAYRHDAQWSLLRKGSTGGIFRRRPEQRAEPWAYGADTTLLEIWRQPLTKYTFASRIWLRTGGRSTDDAVRNWTVSAQLMRHVYRLCN